MGERMLAQLPPTARQYRFYIIDAPVNNAFSLGGSRIYVARQLIVFLQNEDELAGLLGHEIGHVITHQAAIDVTRAFRKTLGVDHVGDRTDIFNKWNQFEDLRNKKPGQLRDDEREEDEQQIADRIGLFAMTRAGYQPLRLADFFDRLVETKGKTGNFLTDFFGTTSPISKRLRELINKAPPLPSQCISSLPADSHNHFLAWQKAVVGARRAAHMEAVAGIVRKATLQPPLRGNLEYLQFSPDGKYLLAQDESNVFVLSREPLATLFRIDALDANWAQFSPDSRSVVMADKELRVEVWDIAGRRRASVRAVSIPGRCIDIAVSSTGETLGCIRQHKDDLEVDLLDVASGATLFTKPINWPVALFGLSLMNEPIRFRKAPRFQMQFSPDGRYFVIGSPDTAFAYDVQGKREVSLPGRIKHIVSSNFTFTANDAIAGFDREKPLKSQLARFPSGELIQEFPLEVNGFKLDGRLIAAPKGPYILVTPAAMHPIAAIDLKAKKLAVGYKTPALAIYDQIIAGEQFGGRVTLFNMADKKPVASVQLPLSYLPALETTDFSTDGKWLAAAGRTSGGIWNAETGERALDTGSFTGGFFEEDKLLATFYKFEEKPRMVSVDPEKKDRKELYTIDPPAPAKKASKEDLWVDRGHVWQAGDLMIAALPPAKGHTTIEAHDVRTYEVRWKRDFPGLAPGLSYSRSGKSLTAVLGFGNGVKDEVKNNPDLGQKFNAMPKKDDVILIEVIDAVTGKTRGGVLIDTGNYSFLANRAVAAGDTVVVNDTMNRTLVYSLKTGQQTGKVLGRFKAVSDSGDQVLVENEKGVADLLSTATLQVQAHYTFPARITYAEFTSAGDLLVLTADQRVYQLDARSAPQNAALQ